MVSNAQRRAELRPHGITSPACKGCYFFDECGGYQADRSLATCFVETCCEYTGQEKSGCNAVCPHKPDFADWLSDVGGLRNNGGTVITQESLELPYYVPMIGHQYSRKGVFDWPVVALDTYKIMRLRRINGRRYNAVATTPDDLRDTFRIGRSARVILRGVAKDRPLEHWWENRLESEAPSQLASLDIYAAVAPNFSHFLGVPRTDNLFNRQRQIICMTELANTGICVMPHLSAIMPADWYFWQSYLDSSSTVTYVAKEFQTGYKNASEGKQAIEQMSKIQDKLNRKLHPIVIGGSQFVEKFARNFDLFTLIDSAPFSKAWQRQEFDLAAGKQPWYPRLLLEGTHIDDLLKHNVERYSAWIDDRIRAARNQRR